MTRKPRILVFAGSTRADSFHRKLALHATAALQRAGAHAHYVELAEYPLPLYDGDLESREGLPPGAKALKELVREHDALVIASPEYNGSFPALIKNIIDWITRPEPGEQHTAVLRGKTAALLSTSPGSGGGQRGLRHLRELLQNVGVKVIETQVAVPRAFEAFGPDGKLMRAEDLARVDRLAAELAAALGPEKSDAAKVIAA